MCHKGKIFRGRWRRRHCRRTSGGRPSFFHDLPAKTLPAVSRLTPLAPARRGLRIIRSPQLLERADHARLALFGQAVGEDEDLHQPRVVDQSRDHLSQLRGGPLGDLPKRPGSLRRPPVIGGKQQPGVLADAARQGDQLVERDVADVAIDDAADVALGDAARRRRHHLAERETLLFDDPPDELAEIFFNDLRHRRCPFRVFKMLNV